MRGILHHLFHSQSKPVPSRYRKSRTLRETWLPLSTIPKTSPGSLGGGSSRRHRPGTYNHPRRDTEPLDAGLRVRVLGTRYGGSSSDGVSTGLGRWQSTRRDPCWYQLSIQGWYNFCVQKYPPRLRPQKDVVEDVVERYWNCFLPKSVYVELHLVNSLHCKELRI